MTPSNPSPTPSATPPALVSAKPTTASSRFAGLEGLRTVGLIAVFASHTGFATGTTYGSLWTFSVGGSTHRPTYVLGHLEAAVAIFFMISAFLLYRPFAAALYANRTPSGAGEFLRRRLVRAFPAYWAALAILFVTNSISARNPGHFLKMVTLTHIYSEEDFFANRTLVPTWTLATELVFYFFLLGYVACMRRLPQMSAQRRLKIELSVLALVCVAAFAWRFLVYHVHSMPHVAEFWFMGTADVFALGLGLGAIDGYVRSGASVPVWDRIASYGDVWAVMAIGFFVAVPVFADASAGIGVSRGWDAYQRNFYQTACAFCLLVPVVCGDQSRGAYRRFVRLRPLAYVGGVSYGIYLWHDHWIVQAVHWSGGLEALRGHFWLVGVTAFALSLICGSLSDRWIEKPALRIDAQRAKRRAGLRT